MEAPIYILHLEDEPLDAELVADALRREVGQCQIAAVSSREDYCRALEEREPDLILSDCSIPELEGVESLRVAQRLRPGAPFIFLSGTLGEERAIELLTSGATDYVLKHRLARLGPAVKRALAEVQERRAHERAEEERARIEAQFWQAQKMEAIGQLAGGVAHDFNNLLSVILSFSGFVFDELPDGSPLREDLQEIRRAAERAAALTRQLLAFSRKQQVSPQLIDPGESIRELAKMLARLLGEQIAIELQLHQGEAKILIDPFQLEQVVVNLAVNARDAMSQGGKLTIGTRLVKPEGDAEGELVELSVADTGEGISKEVLPKIFEPFFTTKPKGKGTGLGLAMVYGAVQQSGGQIEVDSQPGQGTTFRLRFRAVSTEAVEQARAQLGPIAGAAGEVVLLVEDDPAVRQATAKLLRVSGYQAVEAASGDEALQRFEALGGQVDLVLTDVMMPGMTGVQLCDRLRRLKPSLRLLYCTGYSEEMLGDQGMGESGVARVVFKPFEREALLRRIRDALAGR